MSTNDTPLPRESKSQRLGHFAEIAFRSKAPLSWRVRDLSGDDDVGFDARIQVVAESEYHYDFLCQIKGTAQNALSSDGTYYSVQLKVSTLSYMRNTGHKILLVLADLSTSSDPRSCNLYYNWLHHEIAQRLEDSGAEVSQDSELTFRIPAENVLSPDTDVLPFLQEEERRINVLNSLDRAIQIRQTRTSSIDLVSQMVANVSEKGSLYIESAASTSEGALAEAAHGTTAWMVRQVMTALSSNNESRALELLEKIDMSVLPDARSRAEVSWLTGRTESLRGNTEAAAKAFREASSLAPSVDAYVAAELELGIRTDFSKPNLEALLLRIETLIDGQSPSQRPKLAVLRARVLLALERLPEAAEALNGVPIRESAVERGIQAHILGDADHFQQLIAESEAIALSTNAVLTLRILEYKTLYVRAVGVDQGEIVPAIGAAQTNPDLIARLWSIGQLLVKDLQRAAWAPNSELFLDAFSSVALMVGEPGTALRYISDFLDLRPFNRNLQSIRMKVAVFARNCEEALSAVSKLDDKYERAVSEVMVRYDFGDQPGVLQHAEALLQVPLDTEHALDAHIMAALCARYLLNSPLERRLLDRIADTGCARDVLSVYDLVARMNEGGAAAAAAILTYRQEYNRNPDSPIIQDHAVHLLDADDSPDHEFVATLESKIRVRRQLSSREIWAFVKYYKSTGRLDCARTTLNQARKFKPADVQLKALDATISEAEGDSPRAMQLARELATRSGSGVESALGIYANIAMRCGLAGEARSQLKALLASARSRSDRLEVLRNLFSFELAMGGETQILMALFIEYGKIADQEDEVEEGVYVQQAMMVGTRSDANLDASQQKEIASRADSYFKKFPNSKTISRFQVGEEATGEEILKAIREATGINQRQLEEYARRARELESGKLVVPYSWRPRIFLLNVGSIPHLWELTKVTRYGPAAHKLLVYRAHTDTRDAPTDKIPLIDYPTLLVITDLDLWSVLLGLYRVVAITKRTLIEVQRSAGAMGFSTEVGRRLRASIASNVERIYQPGGGAEEEAGFRDGGLEEIKSLVADKRYIFYSDDVLARLYVLGDDHLREGMTSVDLMQSAQNLGALTLEQVARLHAKIYRWNLDPIPIRYEHFVAVVPRGLERSSQLSDKIDALFRDGDFRAFADVAWDYVNPLNSVLRHAASMLARMINDADAKLDSLAVAAFWGFWFDKVALRPDKVDPMDALALCLCFVVVELRAPKGASWIVWSAFLMLVERRYGDRMEKVKEMTEIGRVGKMLATVVTANASLQSSADALLDGVRRGLEIGTERDDVLIKAYEHHRISLEKKRAAESQP